MTINVIGKIVLNEPYEEHTQRGYMNACHATHGTQRAQIRRQYTADLYLQLVIIFGEERRVRRDMTKNTIRNTHTLYTYKYDQTYTR